jgi:hypothetical protein
MEFWVSPLVFSLYEGKSSQDQDLDAFDRLGKHTRLASEDEYENCSTGEPI